MHLQLYFQAVAIMDKEIRHSWLHNRSSIIKILSAKSFIIRVNNVLLKKAVMLWWAKEIGNNCSTEMMLFYYIHPYFISADVYCPVTGISKTNILFYLWDCKF